MKLSPDTHKNEIEILSQESEFGFDVIVKYKQDSRYQGKEVVHHNATEVHWMYNKEDEGTFSYYQPGVAIESDIHSTGGTRELQYIEYILIEVATELHEHH